MVTLVELKSEKADLKVKMSEERKTTGKVSGETFDAYMEVVRRLGIVEGQLGISAISNRWYLE